MNINFTNPTYTFYKVDYINFSHNDGDYFICRSMEGVAEILHDVEHILDSEPDEKEYPYSVIIKPVVMTREDYDKWLEEAYGE